MNVLEAIVERRSVAKLDGDVSDAEILALVTAALHAPNHKLTRPWRFTVLRGAARARLGDTWAACEARRLAPDAPERESYLERERRKPLRAPAIVAISTATSEAIVTAIEDFAATAAATQNLLLAAHARGLGAIWRTGAIAYEPAIVTHLGLDASDRIVAFVYVGRAVARAPAPPVQDAIDVTRFLS